MSEETEHKHTKEQTNRSALSRMRARNYFITIWNDEDYNNIKVQIVGRAEYGIISADDYTKDNQKHWHAFIKFKTPTRASVFRTTNAHIMRAWSDKGCREYCLRKGNPFEHGALFYNDNSGDDWKGFVDYCKCHGSADLIDSCYSRLYGRYRSFAGEIMATFRECKIIEGELKNEWYWGPTGTGKSRKAHTENPDAYIKNQNKWWDGYKGQDVVIIEEWSPDVKGLTSYLKIWSDRYPFNAEVKGSSDKIRPQKIIITSNYSMEECFEGEDLNALKRRFKQIKFHNI